VIVSVDGEQVRDARGLARRISSMAPGTTVRLGVFRDGSEQTTRLTLGELPKERQASAGRSEERELQGSDEPRLGLSLAPANGVAGAGSEGVVVTNVDPDGAAASHGFKTGDVILDVGGKAVSTPSDVRKALTDARGSGRRTVLLRVKSGEGTRFVAIPLGNA
jgi:serine protease Do